MGARTGFSIAVAKRSFDPKRSTCHLAINSASVESLIAKPDFSETPARIKPVHGFTHSQCVLGVSSLYSPSLPSFHRCHTRRAPGTVHASTPRSLLAAKHFDKCALPLSTYAHERTDFSIVR